MYISWQEIFEEVKIHSLFEINFNAQFYVTAYCQRSIGKIHTLSLSLFRDSFRFSSHLSLIVSTVLASGN